MKIKLFALVLVLFAFFTPVQKANAQLAIIQIVKEAAKKVIKAIDLKMQRLQNKTIGLQNIQKEIENKMSKLKLDQISDWVKKQKELYKNYYEELQKVKTAIAYYHRVKDITQKQLQLINQYKQAWALFKQDKHFSSRELSYMETVYTGILEQSVQNLDNVLTIITAFKTCMTDGERMARIDAAAEVTNKNYYDLVRFNQQNKLLALQRTTDESDIALTRKMYGVK